MADNFNRKVFAGISVSIFVLFPVIGQEILQNPNVIIIMADQLRVDLMRREGYPLNTMPFVDSLAGQ